MRSLIISSSLIVAGLIGSSPAFAQAAEKPVCMVNPGGQVSCLYDSFAQCQQAAAVRSVGTDCVANPALFSTTGQGGVRQNPLPPSR